MSLCANTYCKCPLKDPCACDDCMESPFLRGQFCHVCTVMHRVVSRSEGLRKAQTEYEDKLRKRKDTSGL